MSLNKSDKTAIKKRQRRTYEYSHFDCLSICGKIWKRHIWIRQGDANPDWRPVHDENRLLEFEPTDISDVHLDTWQENNLFGDDT